MAERILLRPICRYRYRPRVQRQRDPGAERPGGGEQAAGYVYRLHLGERGLHHLVYEIVDNAIDEALAGYCDHIEVKILEGDLIQVTDNGRGIPVDIQAGTLPAVTVVYTILHAGGKFGGEELRLQRWPTACTAWALRW